MSFSLLSSAVLGPLPLDDADRVGEDFKRPVVVAEVHLQQHVAADDEPEVATVQPELQS